MSTSKPYLEDFWNKLIRTVKREVKSFKDANLDNGERCKNTWECYAYCRWLNNPHASMYENDIVDPACARVCQRLSEFQSTVLLDYFWDEYIENVDVGESLPWTMSLSSRRSALAEVLREAVYQAAASDGCVIEER